MVDASGNVAVGGGVAPGVTATVNPVPVGGVDITGVTRRLLTDGRGVLAQPSDPDTGLTTTDLLRLILAELRIISFISASDQQAGDPDDLRASSDFSTILN